MPTSYAASEMRGLLLEIPEWLLEERRASHADRRDELWDGVLHMSPSPLTSHNILTMRLALALAPIARRRGLEIIGDSQASFDPLEEGDPNAKPQPTVKNWRVPDITVVHPRHLSRRGTEGNAELIVETLSEHDEARDKFPFYAHIGHREIWLVTPESCTVEVHSLRDGSYVRIAAVADGTIAAPSLDLVLQTIDTPDGPCLRIRDGAEVHDVRPLTPT
jgi:hypothetical protein